MAFSLGFGAPRALTGQRSWVAGDQSLENHESHIKTLAAAKCNEQKVPKFGGKGNPTMTPIYGKNTVYFQ